MASKVSIIGQIGEVEREISMRERVYPHQVATGKMKEAEAALLIDRMRAVRDTLLFVQRHEQAFREYYRATVGGDPQ